MKQFDDDRDQRAAYWSTFISGLVLIAYGMGSSVVSFAVLGAFMLLVVLVGNPTFALFGSALDSVKDCGPALSEFVTGLGSKLGGKVSPELAAAVKALNQAHENDAAIHKRLSDLESRISALNLAAGLKTSNRADVVSEILK